MAALIDTVILLVFFTGIFAPCYSQFELDDRFLEYRKDGMWLVEFYAPWCGHCKKLEPIYKEVAKELKSQNSPVKVAKIDCTRFPAVASAFSVKGFPTIIFFKGAESHHHHGDRTKEDILEFVSRAQGPPVRKLSSVGKFNEAVRKHQKVVFFLYIGDDDEKEDLFVKYSYSANTNSMLSYFYYGKQHILGESKSTIPHRHPTVLVYKDQQFGEYQPSDGVPTTSCLEAWINRERHATFPRLSGPGLNDAAHVADYLVILAVDGEEVKNHTSHHARVFEVIKQLALQYKPQRQYQYLWMDEIETVQSIAMSFVAAPCLMVLDPSQQLYYLAPSQNLTQPEAIVEFLDRVSKGHELSYGGTGFLTRLRHMLFDFVAAIISIWQGSRILFLMMFGLPTVVISIVCYSLCCLEAVDDIKDEDDYDDDEIDEEERERRRMMQIEGRGGDVMEGEDLPPPAIEGGNAGIGDREPPSYEQAIQDDDEDEDAGPKSVQDKKTD